MAKETKEERRLRIQKEVAEESAARREAYFKAQEESKQKLLLNLLHFHNQMLMFTTMLGNKVLEHLVENIN